jgi:phospholipid/cholesterol/gamma-HCH transport system permease protein
MAPQSNNATRARGRFVDTVVDGISDLGGVMLDWVMVLGDVTLFFARTIVWIFTRLPRRETLLPNFYQIGVLSLPVVALTGMFIGMVLAVQSHSQFRQMHLETRLGAVINMSLVRDLGPVLAATMLAGRVGSAMAAELATMRVTEQVDALSSLGAHPLHHLVVPRLLACGLLIPLLTVIADFMGIMGAAFICTRLFGVEAHFYWSHSEYYVSMWDVNMGLIKAFFFGCAIALISVHLVPQTSAARLHHAAQSLGMPWSNLAPGPGSGVGTSFFRHKGHTELTVCTSSGD